MSTQQDAYDNESDDNEIAYGETEQSDGFDFESVNTGIGAPVSSNESEDTGCSAPTASKATPPGQRDQYIRDSLQDNFPRIDEHPIEEDRSTSASGPIEDLRITAIEISYSNSDTESEELFIQEAARFLVGASPTEVEMKADLARWHFDLDPRFNTEDQVRLVWKAACFWKNEQERNTPMDPSDGDNAVEEIEAQKMTCGRARARAR
jgi:hypothetical protein